MPYSSFPSPWLLVQALYLQFPAHQGQAKVLAERFHVRRSSALPLPRAAASAAQVGQASQ
jgi:hypothetical protein